MHCSCLVSLLPKDSACVYAVHVLAERQRDICSKLVVRTTLESHTLCGLVR